MEVELFRRTPVMGRYYKYALATRKAWDEKAKTWRYYTTHPFKYMGCFLRSEYYGSGDGKTYAEIYILNGQEMRLDYDYEGNTCIEEV